MNDQERLDMQNRITSAVKEVIKGLLDNEKIAVVVPVVVLSACQITNT